MYIWDTGYVDSNFNSLNAHLVKFNTYTCIYVYKHTKGPVHITHLVDLSR